MLTLGGTSGHFGVGEGGSVICFVFTLYALHFCMAFVSELQFCMTRALVDDAFLLLPFALLPFCQIVFVFYFVVFCVYFVCIVFLYGGRA